MQVWNTRGLSRAALLLVFAIAALGAALLVPVLRGCGADTGATACELALGAAQQKLDKASIGQDALTVEQAQQAATQGIIAWEELCPAGGDCYLFADKAHHLTIVCALHGKDKKLCTRLNAQNAFEQLGAELRTASVLGKTPDSITLLLNGETVRAERTDEAPPFAHGTDATPGYEGTVVLYELDTEGELIYFAYVDTLHCALWHSGEGWTGDCWT